MFFASFLIRVGKIRECSAEITFLQFDKIENSKNSVATHVNLCVRGANFFNPLRVGASLCEKNFSFIVFAIEKISNRKWKAGET